jgi:hypothetical protein
MDEFFKTKVGFTIGLLAAVFAIKPIIEANASSGFIIFNFKVTIEYAYLFLTFCLSLAVYFISLQFASEKHVIVLDKISNFCYSLALATPPVYFALWLVTETLRVISGYLVQIPDSWVNTISGVVSGIFAAVIYDFFRKTIKQKFLSAEKVEERKVDFELLTRAHELFRSGMYDMSVLESSKVVESIIRRLLEARNISIKNETLIDLVRLSEENGILNKVDASLMHEIRKKRNQSVHSFDAIDKETAERILFLSRDLISKLDLRSNSSSYEWLESNRGKVLELFKNGDSKKCQVAIKKLVDAWINRDGALWLEVSDFFEVALIHNPHLIIESFSHDESLLESWLERIEGQLFTDFLGGQIPKLESNKVLMIKSLTEYINSNDKTENNVAAAQKIIREIKAAQITEID